MNGISTLGSALAAQFDGAHTGATALEHRGRRITYAELADASQWIVNELERLDVRKGAHIGVLADDGSLIVPAMIGILALGCVFAILDPAHPPSYLHELMEAADLDCLFVEGTLFSVAEQAWRGKQRKIIAIHADIYSAATRERSVSNLLAQTTERALYVYFSSGTSGKPKPILGRADSLMHFVNWEIAMLGLDPTVHVSQLTYPSHDPYLRDVFTPLTAGGTICIPESRHIVLSPFELGQWLDHAGIQVMHCTPTVFRNLCNGGLKNRTFNRLKYVLIAGEQLRGVHLAAWYKVFGDQVQLINLYGPTETTLAKLYYFLSPEDVGRSAVPIGKPMDGTKVKIMATPSMECRVGEIGELYIQTGFATLGYFRQPELNREAFEPDPSTSVDSLVVTYKTGDLVKRLPDGNIEFISRKDGQKKVRGKQVDFGSVEDEIVARTEIESCIVSALATNEGEGPDQLIVYYIADCEVDEHLLKQRLGRDLPKSMIPDIWIRVDSFPINPNGKVHIPELASLLSKYDSSKRRTDAQSPDPAAGIDYRLMTLWKELLRNDTLGLDDPFMEVGGDSLSIMLLIARVDQDYGYNLSLWQVFESLTIRKLASLIDDAAAATDSETAPPFPGTELV